MSGPANIPARRQVHDLDQMLSGVGVGWEGLEDKIAPALLRDGFRPADTLMETLARMWQRPTERQVLEWIFDLTSRAPYPVAHGSAEELGLAAAKHMARAAVGEAIAKALDEGLKLINAPQT